MDEVWGDVEFSKEANTQCQKILLSMSSCIKVVHRRCVMQHIHQIKESLIKNFNIDTVFKKFSGSAHNFMWQLYFINTYLA